MPHNRGAPPWRVIIEYAAGACLSAACAAGAAAAGQKVEWVFIDGAKNPELIPEWSAWEDVFSTIAGGRKQLPSKSSFASRKRRKDLILRESDASVKRTEECNARILALKPMLAKARSRCRSSARRTYGWSVAWPTSKRAIG